MPGKPYETGPYIEGALDTEPEAKIAMEFLYEYGYVTRPQNNKEFTEHNKQITDYIELRRQDTERRYKDTPTDVKRFLDYLRRNRILHGDVDTDYELDDYNIKRENQEIIDLMTEIGLFGDAARNAYLAKVSADPSYKPRKPKRHHIADDEDPENNNPTYGGAL